MNKTVNPPPYPQVHAAISRQDWRNAAVLLEQCIACEPQNPLFHRRLAAVLIQQGSLWAREDTQTSRQYFTQALPHAEYVANHHPTAEDVTQLGFLYGQFERREDELRAYEHALTLNPHYYFALRNAARLYAYRGDFERAVTVANAARAQRPHDPDGWVVYVDVLSICDRWGEAWDELSQLLQMHPSYPVAREVRRNMLLADREFAPAWEEQRWLNQFLIIPGISGARAQFWDGSPCDVLTIRTEGGAGDSFQFLRYVPLVKSRVRRVKVVCPSDQRTILARFPGVDATTDAGVPDFEGGAWCTTFSLPAFFPDETLPPPAPYVKADPAAVASWQRKLGSRTALRVGLVWHPGLLGQFGQMRTAPLTDFVPLADVAGVEFYNLQKGPAALDSPPSGLVLHHLDLDSWETTAAVMACLDLIITVDTGPAHLAGALGRPTWVLVHYVCDWRWQRQREASSWYGSVRIFRQPSFGDWPSVMQRVAEELRVYAGVVR